MMQLETITYRDSEWSKALPDLDSKQTLVLVFGAPEYRGQPQAFDAITQKYPNSIILGCSTSGEIFQEAIADQSMSVGVAKFEHSTLRYAESRVAATGDD